MSKILLLGLVIFSSMGACWSRNHHNTIVSPIVVQQVPAPIQYSAPIYYVNVVQSVQYVPIVENNVVVQPVVVQPYPNVIYNYQYYYTSGPYVYNLWGGYNY